MIEPLSRRDEEEAVVALAEAFRDNALNRAVICSQDPAVRLRSNAHGMRALLPSARLHGDVRIARSDTSVAGALVASPPGTFPLPSPGLVPRLQLVFRQGWQVSRRWGEVFVALEALHPVEPHWYLGTLGVAPRQQRRGFGRALLEDWVLDVDRDGVPAYLETDDEAKLRFYGAVGFELVGETEVLGVRVFRMSRPVGSGSAITH